MFLFAAQLVWPIVFFTYHRGGEVVVDGDGKGVIKVVDEGSHTHRSGSNLRTLADDLGRLDCRNPANCYSSQCFADPSDFRCRSSPYYQAPHVRQGKETFCVGQPAPDRPPALPPLSSKSAVTPWSDRVDAFKYFTAKPFEKWYDWPAKCAPKDEQKEAVSMSARHEDTVDKIYRLKNFCLRPIGKLAGYNPKVEPFDGTDDVQSWTQDGSPMRFVRQFLTDVEVLPAPPTCFIDRPLLLMPSMLRMDNPGHVFMREAALLEIRNKAFPNLGTKNVTTAYIMLEEVNSDLPMERHIDLSIWNENAFTNYMTVLTSTHFAVYAGKNMTNGVQRLFGKESQDPRTRDLMCFKEAALYFTLLTEEAQTLHIKVPERPVVPLFRHRTPRLLEQFDDRLRECAAVGPRRPGPNLKRPKVLISVRSSTRKMSIAPELIWEVGKFVESIHGELQIHEMKDSDTVDLVRLYSTVDVAIALYGAGLFYTIFMPKGSVVIEISWQPKRASETAGVNQLPNRWTDYGGNLFAVGVHHLVLTFPAIVPEQKGVVWLDTIPFQPEIRFSEFNLAPKVVTKGIEIAKCIMEKGLQVPEGAECADGNVLAGLPGIQRAHFEDHDGALVRQYVRSHHGFHQDQDVHSHTSHLPWFFAKSTLIADAMRPLRMKHRGMWNKVVDPPPTQNRVLVVAPCGPHTTTAREVAFLLHYIAMNVNVTVWSPAESAMRRDPPVNCPRDQDSPRELSKAFGTLPNCLAHDCEYFTLESLQELGQVRWCESLSPTQKGVCHGENNFDVIIASDVLNAASTEALRKLLKPDASPGTSFIVVPWDFQEDSLVVKV